MPHLSSGSHFLPSRSDEQDAALRSVLTRVLHTSLRQCGTIGLVASVLYLGLSVFGLGYDLTWTYEVLVDYGTSQQIVVIGLLIGAALSVIGLILSQIRCSLQAGRLFGGVAILLATVVATFEGTLRSSFSTEYVILIYLLVVSIIPFRPLQVAGIGGLVAAVVYLLGPTGAAWTQTLGMTEEMGMHLAFVGGGSVLVFGASVVLYVRHHSFATTQASLQKNLDLLSRTQEVAKIGGWKYDPLSDTVVGTDELHNILSLMDHSTLTLDSWLQFYDVERRPDVRSAIQECIDDGTAFDLEVPLTTGEGNIRWVRLRGKARSKNGEGRHVTGILQDLTERRSMEQKIQNQERMLRSITENVSDGIYRFVPTQGLVYVNPAFVRLFGYTNQEEVLALSPETLYARPNEQRHAFYVDEHTEDKPHEVVFERKDGSTFVGLLGGTVVRDEDGGIQYVDGVVTDITDLKKREEALQGERDRFETLFESVLREGEAPTP